MRISANRQKSGMPQADLASEANQQHQAKASDGVNKNHRHLADVKRIHRQRCQQQGQQEQAIPEDIAAVPEQADILIIRSLENNPHALHLLALYLSEQTLWTQGQHGQHDQVSRGFLESSWQITTCQLLAYPDNQPPDQRAREASEAADNSSSESFNA